MKQKSGLVRTPTRDKSLIRRFGASMTAEEGQNVPQWSITAINTKDYDPVGGATTTIGTIASIGEYKMFNKETWYSLKQMKSYGQNFNGNGSTGGKLAHGKAWSGGLKWAGRGLGAFSAYSIISQYQSGEISTSRMIIEQGSNAISTFGGLPGAAWGVGWELGRLISTQPTYRKNVRPLLQDTLGVPRNY